jgi:hypothetical protein
MSEADRILWELSETEAKESESSNKKTGEFHESTKYIGHCH